MSTSSSSLYYVRCVFHRPELQRTFWELDEAMHYCRDLAMQGTPCLIREGHPRNGRVVVTGKYLTGKR